MHASPVLVDKFPVMYSSFSIPRGGLHFVYYIYTNIHVKFQLFCFNKKKKKNDSIVLYSCWSQSLLRGTQI